MKLIDAEKLRSEVERIQKTGCESPISVCNDILSFIDFLQQEQPEVNLEKEFDDYIENARAWEKDDKVIEYNNGDSFNHSYDIFPIARHFYELGLKARKV